MSSLCQGRIIWATVTDPNGQNPKERPAVIITATDDIATDQPVAAVAITSTLPNPLSPEFVELPWHRGKHPRTGLKKRCCANCRWLLAIHVNDIKEIGGVVPDAQMVQILERIPAEK